MHRKEIEINRNVIERFLMRVRDFVKEYSKEVLISSIVFFVLSILLISGIIFYGMKSNWDYADFEKILNKYNALEIDNKEEGVVSTTPF